MALKRKVETTARWCAARSPPLILQILIYIARARSFVCRRRSKAALIRRRQKHYGGRERTHSPATRDWRDGGAGRVKPGRARTVFGFLAPLPKVTGVNVNACVIIS